MYSFYQIKSKKSEEFHNGVRQVSLNCEDEPEIYIFIWINVAEEWEHIQFVFNENTIEWFKDRGTTFGQTNRKMYDVPLKIGVQKGSRTIHNSNNFSIFEEGVDILNASEFPNEYQRSIQEKIVS